MSRPAPLRHVRTLVGAFNLVVLALLVVGILVLGGGRRWFEKRVELPVTFPATHAGALRMGVPVRLAGDLVGRVGGATREGDRIRARLVVGAATREALRADAKAQLRVPIAGLVGDLSIALDPGSSPAPWPEGKVLEGEAEGDPAAKARETIDRIREQVPAILDRTQAILEKSNAILGQVERARTAENVDRLVRSIDRLAVSVEREQAIVHASASLARLEELLRGLRDGKGTAGKVFTDPALYDKTAVLLDDVHRSWGKIDGLLAASTRIADRAQELADQARGRASEFETLLGQVQLLVLQSNNTLDLVQSHWLLRGTIPEPGAPLPPAVLDGADLAGPPARAEGRP